jgi:hypothetical protein
MVFLCKFFSQSNFAFNVVGLAVGLDRLVGCSLCVSLCKLLLRDLLFKHITSSGKHFLIIFSLMSCYVLSLSVTETYVCPVTHFKCNNHFCIPGDNVCNFVDDCGDGSDENKCCK